MLREDSSVFNIIRSEKAPKQNLEKSFHSMQYRTKIPIKLKYYYYRVSKQESQERWQKDPRKASAHFQLPVGQVESFHHNPLILPFDG